MQGCVLVPTLFRSFLSAVLHHTFHDDDKNTITDQVLLPTRKNSKLFNLARSRARTKTQHILVHELLFADDATFVSHSKTKWAVFRLFL